MPGKHVHFSDAPDEAYYPFPSTPSPSYSVSSLPSSTGPTTPPQPTYPYLPLAIASGSTHRVLQPHHLVWRVVLPTANVLPSKVNAGMPQHVLFEPATNPPLPALTIVHPRLGSWRIEVTPKPGSGSVVRVCDVLEGVYTSLRQGAAEADFKNLPSKVAQQEVTKAYARRYSNIPDPAAQIVEQKKGLKRVDFLGKCVNWVGVVPSTTVPGAFELILA
ncbi:hypothetical protein MIND_00437100 [Mycena indigotica]|uniref:DUF6699 domain-containing protein n=1 Tax=Mycena indigotica TaxID=2126181 RepID=A0A8H6WBK8_9AGAR|nr:uncharacterized protein MIND_00437100 [Mycena indigotica]KAF7306459.1 hypothetical protein MIND_00437100 [Mycena indigotica]